MYAGGMQCEATMLENKPLLEMENLQKLGVVIRCVDSRDEAVPDGMYAGGSDTVQTGEMQCKETMLKSKLLLVLEAEMENMQYAILGSVTIRLYCTCLLYW